MGSSPIHCKEGAGFTGQVQRFIALYRAICDFSLDQPNIPKEEVVMPRPAHLDHSEFFEKLYVRRFQEEAIVESLRQWPRMILVVGERGSGKTSIAYRVKEKMEKDHSLVMIFDARRGDFFESRSIDQVSPNEISALMLSAIKSRYLKEVFPYHLQKSEEKEPLFKLIQYIMEKYDETDRLEEYSFGGVLFYLNRRYRQYKSIKSNATILDWLEENFVADDELAKYILEEVVNSSRLKPSLLIRAAHDIFEYKRQCIWIDNVDGLSYKQQARIQTSLKRLSGSISPFANVVVSVRSENILILDEFDEQQAPPRLMKVYLYLDAGYQEVSLRDRETLGIAPIKVSWEVMKEIIQRRMDFSFEKVQVDKSVKEYISRSSTLVLNTWKRIHITDLANHSIRYLLAEHGDFLEYLCGFSDNLLSIKNEYKKERAILTLYFMWLGLTADNLRHIQLLDIVNAAGKWYTEIIASNGCDNTVPQGLLPVLILSSVWNLSLKGKEDGRSTRPTVEKVLHVIEKIGVQRERMLQLMVDMQAWISEDIPPLLEIQDPNQPVKITERSQIEEYYIISITPRGKAMLRYILNTFGYLVGITYHKERKIKKEKALRFMEKVIKSTEEEQWTSIREPLVKVGKMYIYFLWRIRDGYYPGPKWFQNFMADFGIPIPNYWSSEIGIKIGKEKLALQYEILLTGIRNFFRTQSVIEDIDRLLAWFKFHLNALKESDDFHCNNLLQENPFGDNS